MRARAKRGKREISGISGKCAKMRENVCAKSGTKMCRKVARKVCAKSGTKMRENAKTEFPEFVLFSRHIGHKIKSTKRIFALFRVFVNFRISREKFSRTHEEKFSRAETRTRTREKFHSREFAHDNSREIFSHTRENLFAHASRSLF
jgi:hypothetical protein